MGDTQENETEEQEVEEQAPENSSDDYDQAFEQVAKEMAGIKDHDEPAEETEEPAKEETEETEEQPEQEASESEEAEEVDLPASWKKTDSKIWDEIPSSARAKIKEREDQLTKLVHQKADDYHRATAPFQELSKELEPIMQKYRMSNNPVTLPQHLLRAAALYEHIQESDKLELAKTFLRASGKTLADLEDTPESAIERENRELRERLDQVENRFEQTEQTQQAEQSRQYGQYLSQVYEKFAGTTNVNGEAKYPQANNAEFAKALGSIVSQRAASIPNPDFHTLIKQAYEELGGLVQTGSQPRSNSQDTTKHRAAARSAYSKTGRSQQAPKRYEDLDDAWAATAEEFGLLE